MFYPKHMQGVNEPWEQLPVTAGEYKAGQLVQIGHAGYVCMADKAITEGQLLPVQPLVVGNVYVTTLKTTASNLAVGSKMMFTLDSQVEANDEGPFTVVWMEGNTAGSEIHVRLNLAAV